MTEVTINAQAKFETEFTIESIDRRKVVIKYGEVRHTLHAGDTMTLNFTADVPVVTATPRTCHCECGR